MIAEIETLASTPVLRASHLWGDDLGGGQAAGGVGGLLMTFIDDRAYIRAYDGNGNIIAWADTNGQVAQRNDYDPFGNLLSQQGDVAGLTYGFSTKYKDEEAGLAYYGYRYLDIEKGRWLNRDPIEESGGSNLYGFVGNDGANYWV